MLVLFVDPCFLDLPFSEHLRRILVVNPCTTIQPMWLVGDNKELLAISQDGYVMKYTITNSPYLVGCRQMQIFCNEGKTAEVQANGYILNSYQITNHYYHQLHQIKLVNDRSIVWKTTQYENHPDHHLQSIYRPTFAVWQIFVGSYSQLLTLAMHPTKLDIYYVGTGEGCLYECSIFHPLQHRRSLEVHKYFVHSVEFSPSSPRIYLTCGFDWLVLRHLYNCTRLLNNTIYLPLQHSPSPSLALFLLRPPPPLIQYSNTLVWYLFVTDVF